MALRRSAVELERNLARYGDLALIECAHAYTPRLSTAEESCPADDDLLGFCRGNLCAAHTFTVQQHLDVCPSCMDVATLILSEWGPPVPTEWPHVAGNFRPGEHIDDRYQVLRFLASGGMGEVYEAVDTHSCKRIALKAILASTSDSPLALRSFRREARLARQVRHPNICHVHDTPSIPRITPQPAVPYFTMDLIDGETLQDRIAVGPLPLDETLAIAHQVLLGLDAMHRAGILHLDLKSSNIMLRRGPKPHPVILDFGLARRIGDGTISKPMRPLTGSLAYMPPEQILGGTPSVQNDLFAFGAVLFQMLTGHLPFPTAQPSSASSVAKRLSARPVAPSEMNGQVPAWLDDLVKRCFAERGLRFRHVGEVIALLP